MQSLITVTIAGIGPIGEWDTRTGGAPKSNPPLHRPAGMGPQISYTSRVTYDNVQVSRVMDNENRSDWDLYKQILPVVGSALMTVTEQPLDSTGTAFGDPVVYSGRLADMDQGKSDSESEAPRIWSLDMVCTTVV